MSNQEQSAFDANSSDHEYFASSTEEINVGRGTVTELKTEPPHVYDIVWNMDLNTALTGIKVPYVIDAQEEQHKQGATPDSKVYTLSTEDSTKDIDLTQVITSGQVTELKYEMPISQIGEKYVLDEITGAVSTAYSADGTTAVIGEPNNNGGLGRVRVFDISNSTWSLKGTVILGSLADNDSRIGTEVAISSDGLIIGYTNNQDNRPAAILEYDSGSNDWVLKGSSIMPSAGKRFTSIEMSADGLNVILVNFVYGSNNPTPVSVYAFDGSTWNKKGNDLLGVVGSNHAISIDISADATIIAIGADNFDGTAGVNSGKVSVYEFVSSDWVLKGTAIEGMSAGDLCGSSISLSANGLIIAVGAIKASIPGSSLLGQARVFEYVGSAWTLKGAIIYPSPLPTYTHYFFGGALSLSDDGLTVAVSSSHQPNGAVHIYKFDSVNDIYSILSIILSDVSVGSFGYNINLNASGSKLLISTYGKFNASNADAYVVAFTIDDAVTTVTASNETDCITEMAKLLSTNGTIVRKLAADGTGDVGSTLTIVVTAAVSSGVGNSLKLGSQDIAITAFMTSMKGVAGVTKWYDADSYNDNSVTSQVRNGLAQLFDRDPQLNNLLGSSATSSTFLDSSKIATKLQNNVDDFYLKMFSEQQLREVLEAVYDRGERISGANDSDKLFTFTAGDSITAVVRVVDSDSDSNSDRWLVTLQHTI